ncbi:hypothetical protein HBI56_059870 [Parastagonospora nodorum]|uniref:Uncharacterized protein n=1 Tax=Phaeosphaeria nodorum (strain SN15 / ATCC MYA-4574 / FGSC 10173) TaxID=321614 RepID=A0A7U2F248_PHANO|nr:hypothetical protein HBH56_158740 [Parastagonospora nodorum]QRC97361.1 hypothetical protein JI435_410500 [Parastagonospora nodorum SN15]KAH3922485.1 hypothetical protein HBH54_223170 [Parastagonospora nodorum]KAH3946975.1 hypothetical protein HBH53_123170 [Parastagonospora nodorum]KAH3969594.1 hypothetical protein HBH52_171180 [Parastagonospora nodorum]
MLVCCTVLHPSTLRHLSPSEPAHKLRTNDTKVMFLLRCLSVHPFILATYGRSASLRPRALSHRTASSKERPIKLPLLLGPLGSYPDAVRR